MKKILIVKLITIVFLINLTLAFAPIEFEGIPDDILDENIEYQVLDIDNARIYGFNAGQYKDMRMRGRINSVNGLPYDIISTGLMVDGYDVITENNIENFAFDFVDQYSKVVGVPGSNLQVYRAEFIQNRWYVTLWQYEKATRFYDSRLELRVSPDARVFYLRNTLMPGKTDDWREISAERAEGIAKEFLRLGNIDTEFRDNGIIILPVLKNGKYFLNRGRSFSLFAGDIPADFRFVVSVDGDVVRFNNGIMAVSGKVSGYAYPRNLATPAEVFPWTDARVSIDGALSNTDEDGDYALGSGSGEHIFYSEMSGTWCAINVYGGSAASRSEVFTGESYDFRWSEDMARVDEMNVYYHVSNVHNYVKDTYGWDGMDYQMVATVGQEFDNAYFNGRDINMGAGSTTFNSLACFADIIQHEYNHGVTQSIYGRVAGIYEGMGMAMNEAFSDYFPCSMSDEPLLGEGGLYTDGTSYMRSVSNVRRYPEDYVNECHYDGQIISGAMWDFREMIDSWTADSMAFFARFGYPVTFEDYLIEFLICDDPDGDITNGTNHGWDMVDAFYAHGIGPGGVSLIHEPITMADDTLESYEVEAILDSYFDLSGCSPIMNYIAGYTDTGSVVMEYVDGVLIGEIPACPYGTRVYYNIIVDVGGDRTVESPDGAPAAWHNFRVDEDLDAPVLTHTPLEFRMISNPILITAQAYDNQGIDEVLVEWKLNSIEQEPIYMSFDRIANYYYAYIEGDIVDSDIIEYRIIAKDISMRELTANSPETGWHAIAVQRGFYDPVGPEGHFWSMYPVTSGYMNQWHKTTSDDHTGVGGYSFKFGGESGHDYTNGAEGALELDAVLLEGESVLKFWHKINAEADDRGAWDGGVVEASAGHGWTRIAPTSGWHDLVNNRDRSFYPGGGIRVFSGSSDWREETIELSGIEGWISFRFRFGSDLYVTNEGWYIDDVRIETETSSIEYDQDGWKTPEKLQLSASPNPFNAATKLSFTVGDDVDNAKIEIFDMLGNMIDNYEINTRAGINSFIWNASEQSAGIYLCKLTAGNKEIYEKIIYIK